MDIRLPKLGFSMTEATLVAWLVQDGERVEQGQPLYVIETDKVEQEVAAPSSGVLVSGEIGRSYQVGEVIGELREA